MDEQDGTGWIGLLISAFILLAVLYLRKFGKPRFMRQDMSLAHKGILAKYAIHYQRLGLEDKTRFERIAASFIHEKEWRGVGMKVSDEMKVMVSACAAQLLLGYPEQELAHFETIVLYPDSYRSRTGRMHQGEVRPASGMIMISWRDFLFGYAHTQDAHNVGLHEMAHALWFENKLENGEAHFLHPELLQDWIDHADAEIERIKSGKSRLLRDYAGTNQAEFFAVAVEHFFELPKEFKQDLPELYATLSTMLKQDPALLED